MKRRIKRDYRQPGSPAKFLVFCKKVKHGLTSNPNLTDSTSALCQQYFEKVDRYEAFYHVALDGSHSAIRDRDKLAQEIVVLLDQLASTLEAAFTLNPDALFTTGFTVTQERRNTVREKLPMIAPSDFNVANAGETGRAIATASAFRGALINEVHINQKDPSAENDWFHKALYPDSHNMVLEGIAAGNTFFRMRYHGPEGPGPWSSVVSTTIS